MRAVTLIPTGRLALLPLHAARYRVDGREVCFLDEFAVSYAPSATALAGIRRRQGAGPAPSLTLAGVGNPLPPVESLTDLHRQLQEAVAALPDTVPQRAPLQELVARPTGEFIHEGDALRKLIQSLPRRLGETVTRLVELSQQWPLSLRYAKAELQSIVDLLPPGAAAPFYEAEATRAALLPRLGEAGIIHLSCHGSFSPAEPLQSALHLADGDLTLGEVLAPDFGGLPSARLVALSACQTAITDFDNLPEEMVGLPAGWLQAGAPAVVGTLWPVDDASTALLMTRFYELLLQDGEPPAQALRQAQRWLRDLTNADLEAYLEQHRAIAEARRQTARRMPLALVQELLIKVYTTENPDARPYADPYFWAPFAFNGVSEQLT